MHNSLRYTIFTGLSRQHVRKTLFVQLVKPKHSQHFRNLYINNHSFHSHAKKTKKIRKALVVTKLTRYEFEQTRLPNLSDADFEEKIKNRGTDYEALMHYHNLHKTQEKRVIDTFKEMGVEVQIVNRLTINKDVLSWPDLLVPLGGDGTFLLAASRASPFFIERSIPIVGFNTDPTRSEGRLMLPKQYSTNVRDAVKKILSGDFEWLHRSRIRITLLGTNGQTPVPIDLHEYNSKPIEHKEVIISESTLLDQINGCSSKKDSRKDTRTFTKRMLPYLSLNEVFIGETLSARVSHLHIRPHSHQVTTKTKSSGLCISTGTGSTAWNTSINRLSKKNVEDLLNILKSDSRNNLSDADAEKISEEYNSKLVFEPDDPRLCYSIREQISVGVWPNPKGFESRGFTNTLYVKSMCQDAGLVIDGSIAYPFNDGTRAFLEVLPEDALLTIKMS